MEKLISDDLYTNVKYIIDKDANAIANLSNISRLLFDGISNTSWAGFYLMDKGRLVLGPFQGPIACTIIQVGKGVCGTSAKEKKTVIVPDVNKYPGHIACSSLSRSEIVIPIIKEGIVLGVIDLDSNEYNNYNEEHRIVLEKISELVADIL